MKEAVESHALRGSLWNRFGASLMLSGNEKGDSSMRQIHETDEANGVHKQRSQGGARDAEGLVGLRVLESERVHPAIKLITKPRSRGSANGCGAVSLFATR
jgi:hypothetical protein